MRETSTADEQSYLVQVDRDCDLPGTAERLRALGVRTDQVLTRSSVISGRAHPRLEAQIRSVVGVKYLRREGRLSAGTESVHSGH